MFVRILSIVRSQLQNWLRLVLIVVILGIYANSLQVPYQFDDGIAFGQVTPATSVSPTEQIAALLRAPARIIPMLSFFVQFYTTGENLYVLHAANIAFHLINTMLVYWLVSQLLIFLGSKQQQKKHVSLIAFFVALLFAVHPINTQAVTYLVQRMASIAALFSLLSVNLLLYSLQMMQQRHRGRQLLSLVGMAIACVAALFSKENTVVLPILLTLTFAMASRHGQLQGLFKKYGITLLLVVVGMVAVIGLRPDVIRTALQPRISPVGFPYTSLTYGLTQLSLYPRYIGVLILPIGQSIDHAPQPFVSIQTPVLVGLATVVVLLGVAMYCLKRHPIISLGIFWYMLTMLVEGSIIPINDSFVEHRLYLPAIGLFLAAIYSCFYYAALKNKTIHLVLVLSLIGGIFAFATVKRNVIWQSQESLWRDASAKTPHNPRALYNYSVHAIRAVHPQEALIALYATIALRPDYHMAQNNLGVLLFAIGDYEGARLHFFEALRYQIDDETYAANLDRSIRAVDTDSPSDDLPTLIEEMFR